MTDRVDLDDDHPGFNDAEYRARRNKIAAIAAGHTRGDPIPEVAYTDAEHGVWRAVSTALRTRYETRACASIRAAVRALDLPTDHVPQLQNVTERLEPLSGFRFTPVAGLVSPRVFYTTLGDGYFLSTQYVRHHSVPFYTPEPDIVHEALGHANQLACPEMAELSVLAGRAAARTRGDDALEFLSKVFWFTIEFGVTREAGELKTYGAGILSSAAELDVFCDAEIRDLDFAEMGTQEYDITHFQPILYAAGSFAEMVDRVGEFFAAYDDDAFASLTGEADLIGV